MFAQAATFKALPHLDQLFFGIVLENWVRYFLFAGIAWLLAYVLFKRRWHSRKIVPHYPAASDMRRELSWSVLTVIIYALVAAGTFWMAQQGWTQIYVKIAKHGLPWFGCSIILAIIVHDTYFYWTHRLMHDRRLFRWFHRVHHQSTNPSPWAAYCFGPLEAAVQAGIFPLVVILMPMHPFAFMLFMLWQIAYNVAGHTGYEYHPRWLMDSWLGKFLNTPTNHIQHHQKLRGNYGLYFNVWDRLMGTNHPDYEKFFREVTGRARLK